METAVPVGRRCPIEGEIGVSRHAAIVATAEGVGQKREKGQ
jgi:hypothetical protein